MRFNLFVSEPVGLGFNFWDDTVWSFLIQLSIIAGMIIIANILRRKIKFIRNSLLPTAVLGGLLILVLKFIPWVDDLINSQLMEMITYHMLGLGFLAVAIKRPTKKERKDENKLVAVDTGLITVSTYLIQGIVGMGATIILFYIFGQKINMLYAAGAILPMGFGQGTGQALNFGKIFEANGLEGGATFGLSVAAMGFIVACIVGVIYMNYLKRKGRYVRSEIEQMANDVSMEDVSPEGDMPLVDSVDKFTIQIGIILVCYLAVWGIMFGITQICNAISTDPTSFWQKTVVPLIWGFNFLFASLVGIVVKNIMFTLKKKGLVKHHYPNNFLLDRISGFCFDLMIIAGIAAIDLKNMTELVIPLIVICVLGTISTFFYVKYICRHVYPKYENEMFFAMFGMLTGTASTGMTLLREIDPKFESQAANNLIVQQFPAILFGFPLLLLIPYSNEGVVPTLIVVGVCLLMFIIYNIILLRRILFMKKNKSNKDTSA